MELSEFCLCALICQMCHLDNCWPSFTASFSVIKNITKHKHVAYGCFCRWAFIFCVSLAETCINCLQWWQKERKHTLVSDFMCVKKTLLSVSPRPCNEHKASLTGRDAGRNRGVKEWDAETKKQKTTQKKPVAKNRVLSPSSSLPPPCSSSPLLRDH